MHILRKNDKLNIDNTTLDLWEVRCKLAEEYREVCEAIAEYDQNKTPNNLKNIARETFDLIQMCILILWRCHRRASTFGEPNLIQDINFEHKDKLISERHRTAETGIEIDVKE